TRAGGHIRSGGVPAFAGTPSASYDYSSRPAPFRRCFSFLPPLENPMTIKIGDRVPDGTLAEFIETATETCAIGPNNFQVADLAKGKTVALFAVPGAFTPTCSSKHVPRSEEHTSELQSRENLV